MTEADTSAPIARFAAEAGLRVDQQGAGRPVLVLHGGGGPESVAGFVDAMARHFHVIAPVHPGFGGTARPPAIDSIKALAKLYATLLERGGLTGVLVVGFSMGGWIGAEMAAMNLPRIAALVLANAVGVTVPGHPVLDVFSAPPDKLPSYAFHEPQKFMPDPATVTTEQMEAGQANFAALAFYGQAVVMQDPDLRERLGAVTIPALAAWGESDRIVTPDYGRAYAGAFPKGRFEPIAASGHMPQLEQPQRFLDLVLAFERGV